MKRQAQVRDFDWREQASGTSNQYLEQCCAWLLEPPTDSAPSGPISVRANAELQALGKSLSGLGVADTTEMRKCILCDSATYRRVSANPYTKRHLAFVCEACES